MGEVTDAPSTGERASEAALRARWIETIDRTHYDGCALRDARCALAVVFALLDTTRADLARYREWYDEAVARANVHGIHASAAEAIDMLAADLATAREENAQLKRIRTLLIRALVHASGAPEDAVRDAPMGVANAVARRLTAVEADRDALRTQLTAATGEIEQPGGWREMVRVANAKIGELEQQLDALRTERER